MKVPLSWLKRCVAVDLPPAEIARRLTMAGVEVSAVARVGADWDPAKVLVAHVLRVDPHPNADRLTLPTVDLGGGETATVVCGAPNVAAGQKVVFAREGAMLYSPRAQRVEELRAAVIRGVRSAGMVCSELELGLGEDHEGILVLGADAPVGTPLADYLGDVVLDIDVTPNRPDLLSVLGIAREVAALTGATVAEPELDYPEDGEPIEGRVRIEIADPRLCRRYTASLIAGVRIGPSPPWMQDALTRAGQRPINNVVDVTNYVMLEYGQPLHAFDYDAVRDRTVIVRAARPGEVLVTLDGQSRTLSPPMLVIADARDAIGLAGVMGGAGSEVHAGTTSVLLESASFDPVNTRRTAAALRLRTEASFRFERGLRAEMAPLALRRATRLILETAGGTAARGVVDLYPGRGGPPVVRFSRHRARQVLGVDLGVRQMAQVLGSLGFERADEPEGAVDTVEPLSAAPLPERADMLWVRVPYWRSDVAIEDDLVEEVARVMGYDAMPTTMLSSPVPHHEPQPERRLREGVRDTLVALGMQETISYPLTSLESLARVGAAADGVDPLRVANPLSSEKPYLRTSLRGSVLETLAANLRVATREGARLFELGSVYLPRGEARERDLPDEKPMVVGVFCGPRHRLSWMTRPGDMGFFDAKGVLEALFATLGVGVDFEAAGDPLLQPGRTARVRCGDASVGVLGEVHPDGLEGFDLGGHVVAMFEIDLRALATRAAAGGRAPRTASRFPESERDLALVVAADVPSGRIQRVIEGHDLVVSAQPFDVYVGADIPAGKKSIACRVAFQSPSATLTSEEVNRAQEEVLDRLRRELGVELRG